MTLYLESIRLARFRSHSALSLSAQSGPIAIFGSNGTGKTNLLEAVSLFSPGRGMRRASAAEMTQHRAEGWSVSGLLYGSDRPRDIAMRSRDGAARSLRIDEKPATQLDLGRLSRVLWLVPSMDRLWIEGAEGRRRFLDRMTLSFHPAHGESVLGYEKAMRERNRLLRDGQRDSGWYQALEAQMARAGAQITANRAAALTKLISAQNFSETQFPKAGLTLTHPDIPLPVTEADLRHALTEARPKDMAAGRSRVGPHRVDLYGHYQAKDCPAYDCSTGEQKALLISLILANGRALVADTGAPPILLLDEVAAHLDPDRRAALFDEICALGSQAWMTGTEQSLFNALGSRGQYLRVDQQSITPVDAQKARLTIAKSTP